MFKGASKFYFAHYSCVVIIVFNTGLYKSAFSLYFSRKLVLRLCMFSVFSIRSHLYRLYNICIIFDYIGVRWSVTLVLLYKSYFSKHKNPFIKIRLWVLVNNVLPERFFKKKNHLRYYATFKNEKI